MAAADRSADSRTGSPAWGGFTLRSTLSGLEWQKPEGFRPLLDIPSQSGMGEGMSEPLTIADLTARIRAFVEARDWKQFHNPKEMAVALTAEAGELMQHFVWQSPDQSDQRVRERRDEIAHEMADIGMLLFEMADNCGIDLTAAMLAKMAINDQRYPVEKARGSNAKYNEL